MNPIVWNNMLMFLQLFFSLIFYSTAYLDRVMVSPLLVDKVKAIYGTNLDKKNLVRPPFSILFRGEKSKNVPLEVGGTVDMAKLTSLLGEQFKFSIQLPFEINETTRLFFIGRYRPSLLSNGSDKSGVPCGKAAVINKKLDQISNDQGVVVSAVRGHYLNTLGGDYVLIHLDEENVYVIDFKVRDSRKLDQLCRISI